MKITKSSGCVFADLGLQRPTDEDLLKRLRAAKSDEMTPAEKRAQRISFIHGQTGVDKDRISEILDGE